jgi:hypothetical protein
MDKKSFEAIREGAARRFTRLGEALAGHAEQPPVIDTSKATILDATIAQIGAAMRAAALYDAHPTLIVFEENQIFAQDAHWQRRGWFQFLSKRDGLPILPHELTARCSRIGSRQ